MLTDDVKKQIRFEEIYRKEISESLKGRKGYLERLTNFFNSALGIFLLSTLFVSGFSAIYTKHQENIKKEEYARKVEIELAYRLSFFPLLHQEKFSYTQLHSVKGALSGATEKHPQFGLLGEYQPIFPGFSGRTLFSLLWENKNSLDFNRFGGYESLSVLAKQTHPYTEIVNLIKLKGPDDEGDSEWKLSEEQKMTYILMLNKIKTDEW